MTVLNTAHGSGLNDGADGDIFEPFEPDEDDLRCELGCAMLNRAMTIEYELSCVVAGT